MTMQSFNPVEYNQPVPGPEKRGKTFQVVLIIVLVLIFGLELGYIAYKESKKSSAPDNVDQITGKIDDKPKVKSTEKGLKPFTNEAEFKAYLAEAADLSSNYYGFSGRRQNVGAVDDFALAMPEATGLAAPMMKSEMGGASEASVSVDRFSGTNVQVQGIDEPDIVKTDGQEIYLSTSFYKPIVEPKTGASEKIAPYWGGNYTSLTALIKALPLDKMGLDAKIELYGNLLLKDNVLVVMDYDKVRAFDVSNPQKPMEKWGLDYTSSNEYLAARLYGDKIYLITQTYVGDYTPCPIKPYSINGTEISIGCSDIYHPIQPAPVDTTYNVAVLDVNSGAVINKTSVVGSSSDSQIYMSNNAIYLSYVAPTDILQVMVTFFDENADLFPVDLVARLKKVAGYELSNAAKMTELGTIMDNYQASLSEDDSLKMENEMENRMKTFMEKHVREMMETGIVKIDIAGLKVSAQGFVPGDLLNQFSMDEYEGNLRVATTSGGRGSYFFSSDQSISDVYVLDSALNTIGSVTGLGKGERIYSVRFIADKGYVVTFKETDPFYILNLAKPKAPVLAGELKIPGYSSYLHPLKENIILGVGREDQSVKLSLFDVSDPQNPTEISKYLLKDYWSDVLNTHHAFQQDAKYQIFFMPGGDGGYIFSYADNKLSMTKAVSGVRARRGLFINDYFYVIGEDNIVVLDEKNWERLKEFKLE